MKIYFVDGQIVNEYLANEQCVLDVDCNMYDAEDAEGSIECWVVERSDHWVSHTNFPDLRGFLNDMPYDVNSLVVGSVFVAQEEVDQLLAMEHLENYDASDMTHRYFYTIKKITNDITFDEMIKDL